MNKFLLSPSSQARSSALAATYRQAPRALQRPVVEAPLDRAQARALARTDAARDISHTRAVDSARRFQGWRVP